MDKTAMLSKITEIGTCEDVADRRAMLAELSKAVDETFGKLDENEATISSLNTQIESKENDIKKLQQANYNFFLELSSNKSDEERNKDNTGLKQEEEKQYKSWDELAKNYVK